MTIEENVQYNNSSNIDDNTGKRNLIKEERIISQTIMATSSPLLTVMI